jgi:Spy/CpxP family protein refolding chaperone
MEQAMVKSSFLTVAAALTISMASVAHAAEPDVLPPPELSTVKMDTSACQKMGFVQGSEQFQNCLNTLIQQEDKLNGMCSAAVNPDSSENKSNKGSGRHKRWSHTTNLSDSGVPNY